MPYCNSIRPFVAAAGKRETTSSVSRSGRFIPTRIAPR